MNSIQIHQATSSSNLAKGTNKNHTNVSPKIITHLPKKSQVSFGTLMYISSPRVSLTTPCFFVIFRGKKTQGAPVFSRKKGPINGPENQAPRHLCWCFFNILVVRATGIGVLTEKKRTTASNTNGWIFSRMRKFPKKILNFWRAFKQIHFFFGGRHSPLWRKSSYGFGMIGDSSVCDVSWKFLGIDDLLHKRHIPVTQGIEKVNVPPSSYSSDIWEVTFRVAWNRLTNGTEKKSRRLCGVWTRVASARQVWNELTLDLSF